MSWWERFELIKEPNLAVFPLSIENAHLFVATSRSNSLNIILSRLDNPSSLLGKVYAVIGQFGSGKTTVVAYVRYKFYMKSIDICSININWKMQKIGSASDVRDWFMKEMKRQLQWTFSEMTQTPTTKKILQNLLTEGFEEEVIIKALKQLCEQHSGIIIFFDELHREEEAKNVIHILDFLKTMQPFFTELCKLPIALFIACHIDWEENLSLPKYSGIFSDLITLPPWNSSDAFRLIDKRLRDSAVDSETFKNPITRGAFDKLVSLEIIKTYSPRDWIIHSKRIFENIPAEVDKITPAVISKVFSQVDKTKVAQIQYLMSHDFPNANKLLASITRFPTEEATKLLSVVSYMYRNDLPRPLKDENCTAAGFEDLPLLIEKLKERRIVHESNRNSKPRKIGRGAVETLYEEVYRLSGHLNEFFDAAEERFGLDPEDYILGFASSDALTIKTARLSEEATFEQMRQLKNKVTIEQAKDHVTCAIEEYELFMGSAFSSAVVNRAAAHAGFMAWNDIVLAFQIEKTKDETKKIKLSSNIHELWDTLKLNRKSIAKMTKLNDDFLEIEKSGKPLSEELSETMKRLIPQSMGELVKMFSVWIEKPTEEKLMIEANAIINKIAGKVLRDSNSLRKSAIEYLEIVAKQMGLQEVDEKWIDRFLNFLSERGTDATIIEIVEIRDNPQLYPTSKNQAYKTALYKLGLAFETTLMTAGRNHCDGEISNLFKSSERLTASKMLTILCRDLPDLSGLINTYTKFDRSKGSDDFLDKVKLFLDNSAFEGITPDLRYYTLTILVRNFYSHEGCQDNELNRDEAMFQQTINGGLFSMIQIVRYLLNRKLIKF
jgi:molybdopterin-guanine dinucleotide biosynthesis protein